MIHRRTSFAGDREHSAAANDHSYLKQANRSRTSKLKELLPSQKGFVQQVEVVLENQIKDFVFRCCIEIEKSISLSSKIRLMRSLVTSIFLYACESWTAELQRRIQAMEMRCYRKIIHISYKDHVTNEEVRAKIQRAIGPHEDLLTIVKRRKLSGMVMFPVHQV